MSFLCDNPRLQKIIFEYKMRPLMARVRYIGGSNVPRRNVNYQGRSHAIESGRAQAAKIILGPFDLNKWGCQDLILL